MKILNLKDFLLEKMKIIPISNDELNKSSICHAESNDTFCMMKKIDFPKYEDLLTSGNIVLTKEYAYIAFGSIFMNWFDDRHENMYSVIRYDQTSPLNYRYVYCDNWKETFPNDPDNDHSFDIIVICKSNIDITSITSTDELKKVFDKYELYRDPYIILKELKENKQ